MRALAEAIRTVKDPRLQNGLVSITRCDVTGDLRYAKVYISVLGTESDAKEVMRGLKSAAGWLRREVGSRVQLRYAPELVFTLYTPEVPSIKNRRTVRPYSVFREPFLWPTPNCAA